MALIEMGKPRPGEGVPLKEFKTPRAAMAVLSICPGSDASTALVCWTNPGGRFQSLDPAAMEIRLLVKLPTDAQPGGAGRRLDVPAARELLHTALATLPPGCKTYAFVLDSRQGADYSGDPGVKARVEANFEQASRLLHGLPLTHSGHVNSNARSRCLKLGKNKKTLATMHTALAVFPQAQGSMRTAKHDWPLASALLVVAHVVGATAHPVPPAPAAATRQAAAAVGPAAAAVAAPAAAGPRNVAGAGAAASNVASGTTGSRGGRAAAGAPAPAAGTAAAAAAAGGTQAAPLAAVKVELLAAAVKVEPQAAAPAGAAPVVATPSQQAPKRPMRGAGAGGRSRKRAAAVGAIDVTGDD